MLFSVCETIYSESQVDDDIPDCHTDTEEICSKRGQERFVDQRSVL
jgi:hypothetical protein